MSHTFQNNGSYNVRLRTRDQLNGETDHFVRIYVGVAPPAAGTAPMADSRYSTREVDGVTFKAISPVISAPGNYVWTAEIFQQNRRSAKKFEISIDTLLAENIGLEKEYLRETDPEKKDVLQRKIGDNFKSIEALRESLRRLRTKIDVVEQVE